MNDWERDARNQGERDYRTMMGSWLTLKYALIRVYVHLRWWK